MIYDEDQLQALQEERLHWSQHKAQSGQTYYYNLQTGESQWEKPLCLQDDMEDEWQQYLTEDGKPYWYNYRTKESRWNKPEVEEQQDDDEEIPPDPIKQFNSLLQDYHVSVNMKWEQAVKVLSGDPRWKIIGQIKEKKRLFNDYMGELKRMEKDEMRVRLNQAKEDFFKMLDEYKINNSDIKFWKVQNALLNDQRWKVIKLEEFKQIQAIPEEKDRESLFQDHLDKLYDQERDHMRQQRKTSTEEFHQKLQRFVSANMINHTTTWDQCLKLFSQDRLLQIMLPVDALGVFEETINPLYEQWRQEIRKKYRQNRINFREMLQNSLADGQLAHKTKWNQYVQTITNDERFLNMLGQPGSQPHELFSDFIQSLRQNHQVYKSELKLHLKSKGVKTLEGVTYEQINQLFQGSEIWIRMHDYEKKYYYRYFQENIKNKDPNSSSKRYKKMVKRYVKLLKSIQELNKGSQFEGFMQIINQKINTEQPKLEVMNDEQKKSLFDQFIQQIGENNQQQDQSNSEKKKKKKDKKKKKKKEQGEINDQSSQDKKRSGQQLEQYEPQIEKKIEQESLQKKQDAEDGEIPIEGSNEVQNEAGEVEVRQSSSKVRSKSKHKRHHHKHKYDDYYSYNYSKHSKKSKKHYK